MAGAARTTDNLPMKGMGDRLRARARELGFSDAEVARRLGVGQTRYANYIKDRHEPDLPTFARICAVLAVQPGELLGRPAAATDEDARSMSRVAAAMEALDTAGLSILAAVADGLVATGGPRAPPRPPRPRRSARRAVGAGSEPAA